jgi:hypothetical protein
MDTSGQNSGLITFLWILMAIAIAGLIVGYIVDKA